MRSVRKALIVGGGVAGLSAATALGLRGVACDVVEISPTGEPLGAAITFTGRAVQALDALGVLDPCVAAQGLTGDLAGGGMYDTAGDPLPGFDKGSRPSRSIPDAPGGKAYPLTVGMYRPVFSQILREAAQAHGAAIRLATSVAALRQDEDGVTAEFTDGSAERYDLVLGADGVRSRVRSLAFGDQIQPQYAGQCSVRWMAHGPPIPGPSSHYFGPFGKLLGYPLPRQNLTYVATVCDGDPDRRVGPDEARAILAEQLSAFTAPYVVELARRLDATSEVIFRPFEWLLVPAPWNRGRVLLIGDAAHATTAHMSSGGGMALEDSVVLAECLEAASTVEAALQAFMERRFERVRAVVDTSVALCQLEKDRAPLSAAAARSAPAFAALAQPY